MAAAQFQTFDDNKDRAAVAGRVAALRAELKKRGLDGFFVPRADRQQNEYVPASEERLAWLTGFTGSAGAAIVLADRAAIFVDGRYTLQARDADRHENFRDRASGRHAARAWLEANLQAPAQRSATIPGCIPPISAEKLAAGLHGGGRALVAVDRQSDRRAVDRPPGAAAGAGRAARRDLPARRRRQAAAHPRRAAETARRRAAGIRSAGGRLAVQHPRLGRAAHAAGAGLCAGAARRHSRRFMSRRASSTTQCARRFPTLPTSPRRPICCATSPRSKGKTRALDRASAADALARLSTRTAASRVRRRPDRR